MEGVPGCVCGLCFGFRSVSGKFFLLIVMGGVGGGQERVDVFLSFGLRGKLFAMAPGCFLY